MKAWKRITKEECKGLLMSVGRRLDAVIASKGFATKYEVLFTCKSIYCYTFTKKLGSITNDAIL